MKNPNLTADEQLIMHNLSEYGCLKRDQLVALIPNKGEDLANKIIVGLSKKQFLYMDESDNVKHDIRCESDNKVVIAFYVLLRFMDDINQYEHYKAKYPSEIYFLKNNSQYEIVSIEVESEIPQLNILVKGNRDLGNDDEDDTDETKYIIAVPKKEYIPECSRLLKDKKVLYAVYSYDENKNFDIVFIE